MTARRLTCFDSASPEYTQAFQTFLAHTDQKERALDWLAREIDALERHAIAIDAGAGTGKLTVWLMKRFSTVIAIEPNPTLSTEFAAACPGAALLGETILEAEPGAAGDFVLCSHVFYYLPRESWDAHLLRLMGWLAPGGVLAVAIQNPESDCMHMVDHFIGGRFGLRELCATAESVPGGPWRVRLDTVPARIRAEDLPTACRIAEFILNVLPMTDPPAWTDVEAYVATHFARPDGGYEMSCDQDFLRVESASG